MEAYFKGNVDGSEFFEENYFTNGMVILVGRTFRHLSGNDSNSSNIPFIQAKGGGKTHRMRVLLAPKIFPKKIQT